MVSLLCVSVFIFSISCSIGLRKNNQSFWRDTYSDNVGGPLFLTNYIEGGNISGGREASEVKLPGKNLTSYSGFLTVNKQYNSNLFFWFFPSSYNQPESAPVVLWLNGGPGVSSLLGLFCENGPITPDGQGNIKFNNYSWSSPFNMIYIDSPVGAGFSFTDDELGYARNETDVGNGLYSALSQFFTLFPELKENEFFITGESYAGKYIPALAYAIHTNNQKNLTKINMKGMAIGDGWSDPENMLIYGNYLYELGLIDSKEREVFIEEENKIIKAIQEGDYSKAMDILDPLIFNDFTPYKTYFNNFTGLLDYYNYLQVADESKSCVSGYQEYLQLDEIRKRIHIGKLSFQNGRKTSFYLRDDILQSVKPWIETLLDENYRVLFYNGQLDIICAYPLTVKVLENLSWSGSDLYKASRRKKWMVEGDLAGYSRTAKSLTHLLVRNAGHILPRDQPKWALDLIVKFIFNNSF